jgi:hypothetical protein
MATTTKRKPANSKAARNGKSATNRAAAATVLHHDVLIKRTDKIAHSSRFILDDATLAIDLPPGGADPLTTPAFTIQGDVTLAAPTLSAWVVDGDANRWDFPVTTPSANRWSTNVIVPNTGLYLFTIQAMTDGDPSTTLRMTVVLTVNLP